MVSTEFDLPDPFAALDGEWRAICRRNRRCGLPRPWALEPPLAGVANLADLIPRPGVDREPISAALARLHRGGDALAGRALLQLCVPVLVHLAGQWQRELGRWNLAAWEVVSTAGIYIARLGRGEITCSGSVAAHLVRSIHRDLVTGRQRSRQAAARCGTFDDLDGEAASLREMSAEDAVISGPLVLDSLRSAASRGAIAPVVARALAHVCVGATVEEACHRAPVGHARYYRHRPSAIAVLRHQVVVAEAV